ncbi:MAG: hypothetical protein ACLU99_14520 [Alphaproteobacteria bacterium]
MCRCSSSYPYSTSNCNGEYEVGGSSCNDDRGTFTAVVIRDRVPTADIMTPPARPI